MMINIPKKHYKYVRMLVKAKIYQREEEAITTIFEWGLDEAGVDVGLMGEPDMDLHLLKGRQITIELADKPGYAEALEIISRGYKFPLSKAATTIFLQGLFEHYYNLRDTSLYMTNAHFREEVDRMPHDPHYDIEPQNELMSDDFSELLGIWTLKLTNPSLKFK